MSRFEWPVRVYYEDTDAGGVVFYANYLAFFERARTEWLRHLGLEATQLRQQRDLLFVVRHVQIDYQSPAVLDDALTIKSQVSELGGSKIVFDQQVWRDQQLLVQAQVVTVCVKVSTMTAARIPTDIRAQITKEML